MSYCLKLPPCHLAMPCTTSSPSYALCYLVISSCYLNLLPCHLVVLHVTSNYPPTLLLSCQTTSTLLSHCLYLLLSLATSLPQAISHYFVTFLPHTTSLLGCHCTSSTSWPPICCFDASLPCYLGPRYLVALLPCVGWYFPPPSSFARRSLEKQALQQLRLGFSFFSYLVFLCLFSFVK
jgi:hypothetical protein